jgi:hypothetical protein
MEFQISNLKFEIPFGGGQMEGVTACLLHNESASYCPWRRPKLLCNGGEGKPSAKRAKDSRGQ